MAAAPEVPSRPNIILIMADDLGYECIGGNGGTSYKTPVLDDLAATGVRFEHCYSQPLCTPSRVQIMTGIYNVRNYARFGVLDRGETTVAHVLKKSSYATCIAGKWQLGNEPDAAQHFGFDEACLWQHTVRGNKTDGHDNRYVNPTIDINGKTATLRKGSFGPDVCSDFLCDFMEKHKAEPFFIYYPMILTHCPFVPTPDSKDWDPSSKGSESYKGNAKYFGDMVTYMDKIVGKLTAKLDTLGLRDNTLIIFTGDNGTDKPVVSELSGRRIAGGKGLMTDAGTRVPLIANWPGTIPKGKVSSDLVDFSDFLPTLCEVAGVTVPSTLNLDGRSFLPQLQGKKGNPREWIYCWYSRAGGPTGKEWARNQRYKLYRTGEFYNVSNDVLEKKPLSNLSPTTEQVRAILQEALDQHKDARPAEVSALGENQRKRE
ncbi:MAG: sulfatase-like hydrolase/transferase [Planctomycetes bacterium]|nr:sulfatase-like hydrolase/transferase [Planctomycetota bacterium]